MRLVPFLAAGALAVSAAAFAQFQFSPAERAARAAATERDYEQTLQRLGLGPLRPGVDGMHPDASDAVNYDESKVRRYALPPLLKMQSGGPVRTSSDWRSRRRPELVRQFDHEVYGRVPATAPAMHWQLKSTEQRSKGGVPVTTRHYIGKAAEDLKLAIELDVTLPDKPRGPVPLILELGFPEGFHFPGFPPPANAGLDWTEQVVGRGWGYAILVPYTVQPDDGAGLTEGVIGIAAHGRPRAADEWGALRAWAWGASRAYDLFARDARLDRHRIAVEGLSRYGKTALVAMAYDQRFSIGFIGSSGAGGAKLLRRNFGEQIGNLAASGEYHWFAPNFLKYDGPLTVDDLPVDAHELIALVAPRPLFIGAGTVEHGDGWVDARGSFDAARAASPAYRLLDVEGLVGESYPAVGEIRDGGHIAFRQQPDGHSNALNWPHFLAFAARQWGLSK
jgi:hypothetical protein